MKSLIDLYSAILSIPLKIAGNPSLLIISIETLIPRVLKILSNASIMNISPSPYLLSFSNV